MASPRRKSPTKPGIAALNAHVRHNVRLDRIVYRSIDALQSYHRKLHKRSDAGKAALQSSVATFGLVLPILIDSKGTIVGGEALVEAARSLGYAEVPTLQIDHLDDGEIRLLRIALNKLSEQAEWQEVELGLELGELLDLRALGNTIANDQQRKPSCREISLHAIYQCRFGNGAAGIGDQPMEQIARPFEPARYRSLQPFIARSGELASIVENLAHDLAPRLRIAPQLAFDHDQPAMLADQQHIDDAGAR
jgi:hypothetical protein